MPSQFRILTMVCPAHASRRGLMRAGWSAAVLVRQRSHTTGTPRRSIAGQDSANSYLVPTKANPELRLGLTTAARSWVTPTVGSVMTPMPVTVAFTSRHGLGPKVIVTS